MWTTFSPRYKNTLIVATILAIAAMVGVFLTAHVEQIIIKERMGQAKLLTEYIQVTLKSSSESVIHETDPEIIKKEKLRITEEIRKFNRGNSYIWVMGIDGIMVMHPRYVELEGKDVLPVKDVNGTFVFPRNYQFEFPEAEKEGMFHSYLWPKHSTSDYVLKISHLRSFLPYYWIIGTGVYLDDMKDVRLKIWFIYLSSIIAPLILVIFWTIRSVSFDQLPKSPLS